jgi:hypothetical protein
MIGGLSGVAGGFALAAIFGATGAVLLVQAHVSNRQMPSCAPRAKTAQPTNRQPGKGSAHRSVGSKTTSGVQL